MKKITMFMFDECPFCQRAIEIQRQLLAEPTYAGIEIEMINERTHPEVAGGYDYYYVPSYYYAGEKLHEGAAGTEDIRRILDAVITA